MNLLRTRGAAWTDKGVFAGLATIVSGIGEQRPSALEIPADAGIQLIGEGRGQGLCRSAKDVRIALRDQDMGVHVGECRYSRSLRAGQRPQLQRESVVFGKRQRKDAAGEDAGDLLVIRESPLVVGAGLIDGPVRQFGRYAVAVIHLTIDGYYSAQKMPDPEGTI